jgi:hypothetical protein
MMKIDFPGMLCYKRGAPDQNDCSRREENSDDPETLDFFILE